MLAEAVSAPWPVHSGTAGGLGWSTGLSRGVCQEVVGSCAAARGLPALRGTATGTCCKLRYPAFCLVALLQSNCGCLLIPAQELEVIITSSRNLTL